jgi:hypothetical protein
MTSVLTARPPRREAAPPLPEEVVERARARVCSVVTYSESVLLRKPWAALRPALRALPSEGSRRAPRVLAPGTCERLLFRALEWMAVERSVARGTPFSNPLIIHPRDVCERLCWRATLPQFQAIERALHSLTRVRLPGPAGPATTGVLCSAVPDARRAGTSPNAICPSFVVHFDDRFVESVNGGHLVAVNWSLWVALRDPVARRLLEVLECEWPRIREARPAAFSLDTLSERLPLPPDLGTPQRRELLAGAHEELIRQEYLSRVEPVSLGRFRYHPGSTFAAMRLRLKESHDRLILAGIRTGWAMESGLGRSRPPLSHNIPRAVSSP